MRFSGLSGLLAKVLESRESGLLKNLLAGAGLTFASTAVITSSINAYVSHIKYDIGSLPHEMLSLMGLSQIDYALSVILSAIVSRAAMNSSGIFLSKIK